jgi:hypothetical protein
MNILIVIIIVAFFIWLPVDYRPDIGGEYSTDTHNPADNDILTVLKYIVMLFILSFICC